jgi:hypothetical protein
MAAKKTTRKTTKIAQARTRAVVSAANPCNPPQALPIKCPDTFDELETRLKVWIREWKTWLKCVETTVANDIECCQPLNPSKNPIPLEALCRAVRGVSVEWRVWGIYVAHIVNSCHDTPGHVPPPPNPPFE